MSTPSAKNSDAKFKVNKKARSFRFGLVKTKPQELRKFMRSRGAAQRADNRIGGNGLEGIVSVGGACGQCARAGQLHVRPDVRRGNGGVGRLFGFQGPLLSCAIKLAEVIDTSVLL